LIFKGDRAISVDIFWCLRISIDTSPALLVSDDIGEKFKSGQNRIQKSKIEFFEEVFDIGETTDITKLIYSDVVLSAELSVDISACPLISRDIYNEIQNLRWGIQMCSRIQKNSIFRISKGAGYIGMAFLKDIRVYLCAF
jgi:hypothetical protein